MATGDEAAKTALVNNFISQVHTFITNQAERDTVANELIPFGSKSANYSQIVAKTSIEGGSAANFPALNTGNEMSAAAMVAIFRLMAIRMTRIRKTNMYIQASGGPATTEFGIKLTALSNIAANRMTDAAFDSAVGIVGGQVPSLNIAQGQLIRDSRVITFIGRLRTTVDNFINAGGAHLTITACHNSCHSNCHGARGRR